MLRAEDSAERDAARDFIERIAEALGPGYSASAGYSAVYLPVAEISIGDNHYLAGLESVIRTLARSQSIVIQGRGSQFILKDFPNAFHVLVMAPLELRLKRVGQDMKLSEEAASHEIASYDGSRRKFIKRYFHAEREDPIHYDLVVNTGRLSYEDAASIVVNAVLLDQSR